MIEFLRAGKSDNCETFRGMPKGNPIHFHVVYSQTDENEWRTVYQVVQKMNQHQMKHPIANVPKTRDVPDILATLVCRGYVKMRCSGAEKEMVTGKVVKEIDFKSKDDVECIKCGRVLDWKFDFDNENPEYFAQCCSKAYSLRSTKMELRVEEDDVFE
jgi:hypothetical protein